MPLRENIKFQYTLLFLSLYVVAELYVSTIVDYTPFISELTFWIDFGICMIFLYDFFEGLYYADRKWHFIKTHWIDFVSSIPLVGAFRVGRVVKIFRILRVIRSAKYVFQFFNRKNSFGTLKSMVIISVTVIFLFSLSFHHLEAKENPYIASFSDSLWWTTITTVTVGFLQDVPPMTVEGKFLSVVLIIMGMMLFSTLIGAVTDYFIEDEDIQANITSVGERVDSLDSKMDEINKKLDELLKEKSEVG
ncbi:MAG: ion transporter [Cyclobacteriaceae bacterium]